MEQETEDSIEQPVVNGFLMVELGNSKDTTKTGASISERKTHWCTQGVVQCCRDCSRGKTIFLLGTGRWIHDPDLQKALVKE